MRLKLIAPGRRKGNRFWLLRGTIGGRRVETSTKATDRKDAKQFLADFVAAFASGRAPEPGSAVTFRKAAEHYIAEKKLAKAEVRFLERLYPFIGDRLCHELRRADLISVADDLYPGGLAASKNRSVLTPASSVLHYAAEPERGWCAWLKIARLEEVKPLPRSVAPSDAGKLLAHATGKERLLLTWLFRHGTRITQTLRVKPDRVDLKAGTFDLLDTKSGQWLRLPLHDDVWELLANDEEFTRHQNPVLWPWQNRWQVYRALEPICAAAGIRFTPHQGRHSMASWLVDAGVDIKVVMEAGGWKDVRSVLVYAGQKVARVRAAGEKMPSLKASPKHRSRA
jgi:integrase